MAPSKQDAEKSHFRPESGVACRTRQKLLLPAARRENARRGQKKGDQVMKKPRTVDEYISSAPEEIREKLNELRRVIKSSSPEETVEKISYGMPYYGYKGRLAYFAFFKNHIGFYAMHDVLDDFEAEVKNLRFGRATLRFPLDKKIPAPLIKKIIKATVRKIEG